MSSCKWKYIGSKKSLVHFIERSILDYTKVKSLGDIKSFADLFSGTGSVSRHVIQKGCKHVVSNDLQSYAWVMTKYPHQTEVDREKLRGVVSWLNKIPTSGRRAFVSTNLTKAGSDRMYFTKENGERIDKIRMEIEGLRETGEVNQNEYILLLKCLLEGCARVSNVTSVYAAFLKQYRREALNRIHLNLDLIQTEVGSESFYVHECYNENVISLLNSGCIGPCTVTYLDPPYNNRRYDNNYHVLETIVKYDSHEPRGRSGLREENKAAKLFCNKASCLVYIKEVLSKIRSQNIFISYSSEGLVDISSIIEALEECNWSGIKVYETEHRRFTSHNINAEAPKVIKEYVIAGRRCCGDHVTSSKTRVT